MTNTSSLSLDQAATLIKFLRDGASKPPIRIRNRRDEVLILLMMEAGLRVSEAVNLPYRCVFWQLQPRPVIDIPNTIAKYGEGGEVPISSALRSALVDYHRERIPIITDSLDWPVVSFFIQPRRLSRRQAARIVEDVCQSALGIHVHPHTLRHTFGNTMRRYCDIPTLQKLMRHKHLSSTQVYMHPTTEDALRATSALDLARTSV
jgi:site-specific recombinase XerD